uniref:Uncharacterized protein n=1 Tax=Strigamia maritima TaxID=126957 RepID=T1IPI7_STRMM
MTARAAFSFAFPVCKVYFSCNLEREREVQFSSGLLTCRFARRGIEETSWDADSRVVSATLGSFCVCLSE